MKKIATLAAAVALAWTATADAHGPTRQKVTETIEINASPDVVWNIIKDFGNAAWIPAVASTTAQGGNEKGATRELTLKKGGVIKEELKSYDAAAKKYSYRISDEPDCAVLPVNNYSSNISVEASGSGSKVEWNGAYYRCFLNNNPPPDQNEEAANKAITSLYKETLANVKALAEKK
ncbi:SRPBCC family protein [Methylococcus sp. EFPC2]|uniref:SRPBCC family protein n=1 Tax=Methylococcus sp. EFPC2 TaxID=2812648 RepID=UPI0019672E61|nr:SRPBCC family protein [Methylococcus sp. EFPC2]QSA95895.1 SRPBCC family protein [Methylococcus sp. EFPC2]